MASEVSTALAETMDREKRRLESYGVRQTARLALAARVAAIRAFRRGDSITLAVREALAPMADVLRDGMTAAHLVGEIRAEKIARRVQRGPLSFAADPYREAVRIAEERALLSPARRLGLAAIYGRDASSAASLFLPVLEDKLQQAVANIVSAGLHTRGGVAEIRKAFDAAGVTVQNPYALETIYRKNVAASYTAGRMAVNAQPHIDEILWGYEYVTVGDDRVRASHAALDGTRKPKADPFWLRYTPPWDWGCRCSTIEIFVDEPDLASVKEPDWLPPDDEGFESSPVFALLGVGAV